MNKVIRISNLNQESSVRQVKMEVFFLEICSEIHMFNQSKIGSYFRVCNILPKIKGSFKSWVRQTGVSGPRIGVPAQSVMANTGNLKSYVGKSE